MTKNLGKQEEINIVNSLNNKKIDQLDENLKEIIFRSFKNYSGKNIVSCKIVEGNIKADIEVELNGVKLTYSLKTGSGNAIHQEPLNNFISYLLTLQNTTREELETIKFFIWTDGTIDGSGEISDRMSKKKFKKKYPEKIETIRKFFFRNKEKILKRILLSGKDLLPTNFLLYKNNKNKFIIKSGYELIEYFSKSEMGLYGLGPITFQTWNPALRGQKTKPRDVVQFKWGSLEKDLGYEK